MPASESRNSATSARSGDTRGAGSPVYLAYTSGGPLMYPAGDLGVTALRGGGPGPPLSQRHGASRTRGCCLVNLRPVWDLAVLTGLCERDDTMSVTA